VIRTLNEVPEAKAEAAVRVGHAQAQGAGTRGIVCRDIPRALPRFAAVVDRTGVAVVAGHAVGLRGAGTAAVGGAAVGAGAGIEVVAGLRRRGSAVDAAGDEQPSGQDADDAHLRASWLLHRTVTVPVSRAAQYVLLSCPCRQRLPLSHAAPMV